MDLTDVICFTCCMFVSMLLNSYNSIAAIMIIAEGRCLYAFFPSSSLSLLCSKRAKKFRGRMQVTCTCELCTHLSSDQAELPGEIGEDFSL